MVSSEADGRDARGAAPRRSLRVALTVLASVALVGAASCVPPVGPDPATLGPSGDGQVVAVHLSGAYAYATSGSPEGSNLQVTRGADGAVTGVSGTVSIPGRGADAARLTLDLTIDTVLGLASGSGELVDPAAGLRVPFGALASPVRLDADSISGTIDWFRAWKFIEFRPFRLAWSVSDGTVAAPAPPAVPVASSGSLRAITYNVAGLPEPISGSLPATHSSLISPLLNDYDLVLVQEDFFYPDHIAGALTHPFGSDPQSVVWGSDPTRPDAIVGSGLERYSRSPFTGYRQVRWPGCFGGILPPGAADCLSQKGFSVATHTLAAGVTVDVYDLHGEAGSTAEDNRLSAEDYRLLAEYIDEHSAGHAVIVAGDYNLHPDEADDAAVLAQFQVDAGVTDVCRVTQCSVDPDTIDRFLYRSSATVHLEPRGWDVPGARFSRPDGTPLSDHRPSTVTFDWSLTPG